MDDVVTGDDVPRRIVGDEHDDVSSVRHVADGAPAVST
jgi:hypothetical protein